MTPTFRTWGEEKGRGAEGGDSLCEGHDFW